jgi:hypothetical protein
MLSFLDNLTSNVLFSFIVWGGYVWTTLQFAPPPVIPTSGGIVDHHGQWSEIWQLEALVVCCLFLPLHYFLFFFSLLIFL